MFAIALFDNRDRRLHLIRDRFGEKPLYYGWCGKDFVFGSELKIFHRHPDFDKTLDPAAVDAMLRYAAVPAPASIFRDVRKLPPAGHLTLEVDPPACEPEVERYWSYRQIATVDPAMQFGSEAEALDAIEDSLAQAIGEQAMADVPVGAFLSGGIDSTMIVALYRKYTAGTIRTFSIGFDEAEFDKSAHARRVAEHLGTEHEEQILRSEDAMGVIPQLATMYDEPFADMSQIPTYLVSVLARRSVTVALSGDGGDELFGGYNRHIAVPRLWRKLSGLPVPLRWLAASGSQLLPGPAGMQPCASQVPARGANVAQNCVKPSSPPRHHPPSTRCTMPCWTRGDDSRRFSAAWRSPHLLPMRRTQRSR